MSETSANGFFCEHTLQNHTIKHIFYRTKSAFSMKILKLRENSDKGWVTFSSQYIFEQITQDAGFRPRLYLGYSSIFDFWQGASRGVKSQSFPGQKYRNPKIDKSPV